MLAVKTYPQPVESDADMFELIELHASEANDNQAPPLAAVVKKWAGVWRRRAIKALKAAAVATAVGGYPALMIAAHEVHDAPLTIDETSGAWTSSQIAAVSALLDRELDGSGWAADAAEWRPIARLNAMPAWQEGIAQAAADFAALRARYLGGDSDLRAAARLLDIQQDTAMAPRIYAAGEAFRRFDGRIGSGFADAPIGKDLLIADLRLVADWAGAARDELAQLVGQDEGWPASKEAVRAFYHAKARAYVAHALLAAAAGDHPELIVDPRIAPHYDRTLESFRRAAQQRPLFVDNRADGGFAASNHLAAMAFMSGETRAAAGLLADVLAAPEPEVGETMALVSLTP